MDLVALKAELDNDPLARGYAGMTNQQVADDLNTVYREVNRTEMTGSEVLNQINKAEFNALSAADQQRIWDILHLANLNPFGVESTLMIDIFGGGSSTITTLQAARKQPVSRGVELGLGIVGEGDVWDARNS